MSKITSIEPLLARVGIRNQLLVKVTTEDGLYGWGESGLSSREGPVAAAIEHFAEFLVGKDSNQIGRIWQECYRSQYFEGGRVLTSAMSAIDLALHDILGKRLGVPVYQLLGGKQRDEIPTFPSCQAPTIDQLLSKVRALVETGWDCVRIYSGDFAGDEVYDPRRGLVRAAEELIAIRQEFGSDLCLGIDLHHRLSVAEAANFCARLPAGTLDFLEEPIRCQSPQAYRMLRDMTTIPFAIGEEFSSKWEAAPYVEQGLTQYMRLDVCNVGGLTEAMKIAGWCELHYVDLMPHNPLGPVCTAATVHLAAAVPNFSWAETRQAATENLGFHDPELFPVQIPLSDIVYKVPDRPGLGVEVDEEKVRNTTPEHVEPPHLSRPDGSVTNW